MNLLQTAVVCKRYVKNILAYFFGHGVDWYETGLVI